MDEEVKRCPFCAEIVLVMAKKCKHCGSMLDGSAQSPPGVVVRGVDPFSHLHTEIQGKKDGKLTIFGYMGIGLGLLLLIMSAGLTGLTSLLGAVWGVGFIVTSYLWARTSSGGKQSFGRLFLAGLMLIPLIGFGSWLAFYTKPQPENMSKQSGISDVPPASSPSTPAINQDEESSRKIKTEPFTVKLVGSDNYMQTSVVFLLANDADKRVIQGLTDKIRYGVLLILTEKSFNQVSTQEGQATLAKEILRTVRGIVGNKATIENVAFDGFTLQ